MYNNTKSRERRLPVSPIISTLIQFFWLVPGFPPLSLLRLPTGTRTFSLAVLSFPEVRTPLRLLPFSPLIVLSSLSAAAQSLLVSLEFPSINVFPVLVTLHMLSCFGPVIRKNCIMILIRKKHPKDHVVVLFDMDKGRRYSQWMLSTVT